MSDQEKKVLDTEDAKFEEMESAEEMGDAQDYLKGVGIGLGIVAGVVALT
jgi:hypothetical protein